MMSKFQEILEPTEAPTYTHPHLNVSLDDILKEGRDQSTSDSSESSPSTETPKSPTSPTSMDEGKAGLFKRRTFMLGTIKGRRGS
jgi:hypothetical protein